MSVLDTEEKPLLNSITITNSKEGGYKLFALFMRLSIENNDVIIGMDATRHYWISICEYLIRQSYDVCVTNSIQSEPNTGGYALYFHP